MDKLKENAFALSLGGMALLLLAVGYLFVVGPVWGKDGLGRQEKRLRGAKKSLDGYLGDDVLPTAEYNRRVNSQMIADLATYKDAEKRFSQRCSLFGEYFQTLGSEPNYADFSAAYNDATKKLRSDYWATFPEIVEAIEESERGDPSKVPPFLEVVKDEDLQEKSDEQIPFAMKQFWIAQAVFQACSELKIAGLQKIEIIEPRDSNRGSGDSGRGSSRSRRVAVEEPPYKIESTKVEANVTVQMRYGQFEDFLAKLLDRNNRVPFIEPETVKMSTLPEQDPAFMKFIRRVEYSSQQKADAAKAAGEPKIVEPLVEFKIKLTALDFAGVTRKADSEKGDGEEEDEDDEEGI